MPYALIVAILLVGAPFQVAARWEKTCTTAMKAGAGLEGGPGLDVTCTTTWVNDPSEQLDLILRICEIAKMELEPCLKEILKGIQKQNK